jgi:broad specificity phosphatase PhoE
MKSENKKKETQKTTFYFVRHGQTNRNMANFLANDPNERLNDEGKKQALQIANDLPEKIDAVVSSPLKRTRETTNIILDAIHYKPLLVLGTEDITELNWGELAGKTWEEVELLYKINHKRLYINQEYDFTIYGGESFDLVKARTYSFIEKIKERYPGKKILVVTHAGIIRCLHKAERNFVFIDKPPSNASIHKFVF